MSQSSLEEGGRFEEDVWILSGELPLLANLNSRTETSVTHGKKSGDREKERKKMKICIGFRDDEL